jgi:hypothetical protein
MSCHRKQRGGAEVDKPYSVARWERLINAKLRTLLTLGNSHDTTSRKNWVKPMAFVDG